MSSKRFFGLFSENSHKTKNSNSNTDNYSDSFETGRRRMSISRSGRFKEHKHRGLITEKTFTGLPNDSQTSIRSNCAQDPPVSEEKNSEVTEEKNSEVTVAHISVYSAPELQNEQWESANDATAAFNQKKEEAVRVIAASSKQDTSV
jgi:flagellar basal body rod protein FlgG